MKKWKPENMKAIWGKLSAMLFIFFVMLNNVAFSFAKGTAGGGSDYAKNAGEWISDQLFWVGLIVLIIALVGLLIKRNYVGCVVTLIGGGIVLYFIANPEKIGSIGETIAKIIFK